MVKGIVNGTTTYYPGKHFNKEITNNIPKVQKFYIAGTMTIAVRTDSVLQWILPDHLGSTSTAANLDGTLNSVIQYTAFGEIRSTQGITPTKYRYTGQLAQAELGLDYYVARWYDPAIGHFTQADTLVPEPGKASAFDRYAYVQNNPLRYNDPSGHDGQPPDTNLIQMAIDFFSQIVNGGWSVVGDPLSKSANTNGADIVFTRETTVKAAEALCVDIKDVAKNVTLSTLRKGEFDYGGSISRVVRSATRFKNSSIAQLKMESDAVLNNTDNLRNAIFTNAKSVSNKAMEQFNGVYTNAREEINSVKPLIVGAGAKAIKSLSSVVRNAMNVPILLVPFESILEPPFKQKNEIGLRKMKKYEKEES